MLKMIFSHTSMDHCKTPGFQGERPKECDFFLTAIRLASLNQILDPWVYLLLRKILLRKFCQGEEPRWRQSIRWEGQRDSQRTNVDEPDPDRYRRSWRRNRLQRVSFVPERHAGYGLCQGVCPPRPAQSYPGWELPGDSPKERRTSSSPEL
ncbi:prostaglandin E2 receptor EP3 subtype [Gracilinanus agilis]|uniref:prostaglandin E2 receptor EP3 subtype n=1 Tax=Gracilinanus agilis TaxID=191870 RepID=UPI001CFCD78C|nr:prostaglandin E2 receptor EP3 subtype [Gracilinanus agilis]